MMRRLLVYSVLGSLLAHPVWMNAAPDVALPRTMLYDNKPIHPECLSFFGDSSRFDPVNLATCGHAAGTADGAGVLRSVSRGDESWQEYQPPSGRGYDRYRYLGTRGGLSYIQNEGNWGGSGNFSWVNALTR